MNLKKTKLMIIAGFVLAFAFSVPNRAEAADISKPNLDAASGASVDMPDKGENEAQEEKENAAKTEIFDEFDLGGISFMVTDIKDGKTYVSVNGAVNDKTTTVYIPQKVKYNNIEMIVDSIAEDCFAYLEKLKKVVIDADITYIDKDAFKEAAKFNRLVIRTGKLKKVEKNAFKGVSKNLVIEVPKKMLKSYGKLFKNKGIKVKEIKAIKK